MVSGTMSPHAPAMVRPQQFVRIPPTFNLAKAKMIETKFGLLVVEPDSKPLIIRDGVARELEV